MFERVNRIFCLSMGNHLESCKEDVRKMEKIMKSLKIPCISIYNCNPQIEIRAFLANRVLGTNDLLIIHYSGHGKVVGRKIGEKVEMISTWLCHDEKINNYSNDVDYILSRLNCRIILISDSCHSGKFGDYYVGKAPYIFIGSSSIVGQSNEYSFPNSSDKLKSGALVNLFEYILLKIDIKKLTFPLLTEYTQQFYKEHSIKVKPILKSKNL
jgi:hypothetical protein